MEWRGGEWRSLQRFEGTSKDSADSSQQALRRWGAPLLVGSPEAVGYLAPRLTPRRRPIRTLVRRLSRLVSRGNTGGQ